MFGKRLLTALLPLAAGCAVSQPTPRPTPGESPSRAGTGLARPSSLIGPVELRMMTGGTAVEAIRHLRPQFLEGVQPPSLNGRKAYPSVYVENRPLAGLESLSAVPVDALEDVRFLNPSEARNVYGPRCSCDGGVILLRMRRNATILESPATLRPAADGDRAEGTSSDVITTAELRHLDQGLSVLEVVEHVRPWFLHPRGSNSMVSIDDAPPTTSSVLRGIYVGQVKEIRLLRAAGKSGPLAMWPNGTVGIGSVILVVSATGRP
jgi:hypothetical protein